MAQGKPPLSDAHPMRVIFMIPNRAPPEFENPAKWSTELKDFVKCALTRDPNVRPQGKQLQSHAFLQPTLNRASLLKLIDGSRKLVAEAGGIKAAMEKKAREKLDDFTKDKVLVKNALSVSRSADQPTRA